MPIAQGRSPDLPGYDAPTFTLMSVGSTPRCSVQVSGFASLGLLTPPRRLYPLRVPRTSVLPTASFGSPVTRGTLAAQLTLPLVGCVEDLHLQVSAPCRAHQEKAPDVSVGGFGLDPGSDLLSHGLRPHYHRRRASSLPSSEWDRVVPARYSRQANF